MKVLIIDDSRTIRAVVSHCLAPLGLTVLQASDGVEGLEVLRGSRPDLAIVDVQMPNMDGLTMLAAKARDPHLAAIPVIMLTARADQSFVLQTMKLGAKAYVIKPFDKQTMVQKVCKVLHLEEPKVGTGAARNGPTILVVDSDEKQVSSLVEFLMDGCEVLTAQDQRAALKAARDNAPEQVWLGIDGDPEVVRGLVAELRELGIQNLVGLHARGAGAVELAGSLGITNLLPRPFIRLEVRNFAARHLGIFQRFLQRSEDACVLSVPADPQARVKEWLPALGAEVKTGIERHSTEGANRLLVDLSGLRGPADLRVVQGLVLVRETAGSLNMGFQLVVPDDDLLRSFVNYQDLKGVRCARGMHEALHPSRNEGDSQAA